MIGCNCISQFPVYSIITTFFNEFKYEIIQHIKGQKMSIVKNIETGLKYNVTWGYKNFKLCT